MVHKERKIFFFLEYIFLFIQSIKIMYVIFRARITQKSRNIFDRYLSFCFTHTHTHVYILDWLEYKITRVIK